MGNYRKIDGGGYISIEDTTGKYDAHDIKENTHDESERVAADDSNFEKVCRLKNEGMTQSEIVEELKINKSTVSRHVNRGKKEHKINLQNV